MSSEAHKLYIETVGCQMNMLDSEMVVASLRREGYELADNVQDADTILFNTCSVREQAENKTYSALGRLRAEKKNNPHKIIGVMGCMAQKDQTDHLSTGTLRRHRRRSRATATNPLVD